MTSSARRRGKRTNGWRPTNWGLIGDVILDRGGLCLDSVQYRQLTPVGLGGSLAFQRSKVLATRAAASRAIASSCSFGAVASTSACHSGEPRDFGAHYFERAQAGDRLTANG